MVAAGLPLFLGCTAFAVDVGSIELESRRLQGLADAAALSAAADPGAASTTARAVVEAAGWPRAVQVAATPGSYAGNIATAPVNRFTPSPAGGDAARVTLTTASPTYFASIFGVRNVSIVRTATAVAFTFARNDGWYKNQVPGEPDLNQVRNYAVRASLRTQPADGIELILRASTSLDNPYNYGIYGRPLASGIGAGVYELFGGQSYFRQGLAKREIETSYARLSAVSTNGTDLRL